MESLLETPDDDFQTVDNNGAAAPGTQPPAGNPKSFAYHAKHALHVIGQIENLRRLELCELEKNKTMVIKHLEALRAEKVNEPESDHLQQRINVENEKLQEWVSLINASKTVIKDLETMQEKLGKHAKLPAYRDKPLSYYVQLVADLN